jgi:hypothetical protein
MQTKQIPEYVLKNIQKTLERWANINDTFKKESCLDRDTVGCLNGVRKILNDEELTGMERLEEYKG